MVFVIQRIAHPQVSTSGIDFMFGFYGDSVALILPVSLLLFAKIGSFYGPFLVRWERNGVEFITKDSSHIA